MLLKYNYSNFVNLNFVGTDRYGIVQSPFATVVLNNPGYEITDLEGLQKAAARLFGWNGDEAAIVMFYDKNGTKKVNQLGDCKNTTVFVKNVIKTF